MMRTVRSTVSAKTSPLISKQPQQLLDMVCHIVGVKFLLQVHCGNFYQTLKVL